MKTLPISVYQERFWLEWMMNPQGAAYNHPFAYRIEGELDHEKLQEACTWIMNHYEPFQAYFNSDGSEQYQGEYTPQDYFKHLTMEEAESEAFMRELIATPFDLTQGPLAKFFLIQHHQANTYHFVMLFHHIIVDAMAMSLLVRDLSAVYSALVLDQPIPNSSLQSLQQCVESERSVQTASWRKAAASFWQDFLGELPLSVPLASQLTTTTDAKVGSHYFSLSAADSQGLKVLASQYGTTPFTLLAAVYGIVLSRYAGQSTLLLSYPVNMRPRGFERTAGCFVNNVPLKLELTPGQSFRALVLSLNEQRKVVRPYQGYPLTNILHDRWQALGIRDETYLNVGLVDTNLNAEALGLVNTQTEALPISSAEGTYDWCLLYDLRGEGGIGLRVDYKVNVFDSALVRQWSGHFEHVLQGVLAQPDINHSDIALLTAAEYEEVVYGWNRTATAYPQDKTVHELFEDQVVRTPEKVAVVFEGEELTYDELNRRANQLARVIQKAYQDQTGEGIKADTLIGISVEASLDLVIGILGILKSGGGYVPIDPGYPAERIQYMLADTGAQVLLTQSNLTLGQSVAAPGQEAQGDSLRDLLPGHISILYLDQAACYAEEAASNLPSVSGSHDLAYVIYTSGTTGKPKGVMIEHQQVVRLVKGQDYIDFENRVFAQAANIAFDATTFEIWAPLLSNAQLVIMKHAQVLEASLLSKQIQEYHVDTLWLTASLFDQLVSYNVDTLNPIRQLLVGGDIVSLASCRKLLVANPSCQLVNGYGPTEGTVFSTTYLINSYHEPQGPIPIGSGLHNTTLYVLGPHLQPVPLGVSGELYIGGDGVARGYLNQDELTQERFIANPFASQEDKSRGRNLRLYKTGDLVKWLPDGNLVYLGRSDFQVKLRGYRIELGEIESVLSGYGGIAQCVVLMHEAKEQDQKYLVAYYVLDAGTGEVTPEVLRTYLQTRLPEYMVPSFFVQLEELPLTVNGKIDRKSLPEPDVRGQIAQGYVAPRTETEHKLCQVWQTVLGLDQVGVQDSFFHIGGHSLLAIELAQRLSQSFSIPMPVKALFDNPTIRQLGHYVEEQQSKTDSVAQYTLPTIESHAEAWYQPFPLTPVQQAYLLGRESLFTLGNIATHVYIVFRFAQLDVGRLEQAWNTLIKRHLALRTVFEAGQQRFLDSVPAYTIRVYKLEDETAAVVQQTLDTIQDEMSHQVFDPTEYPLFDLRVSQLPEEVRLHCSLDALLMDGFSMMLLFDELTTLYQEPAASLPPLAISFRDYILELEALKESEPYRQDQQYWQAKLPNMPFGPALALQKQPAEIKQPVFARLTKTIESSIWQAFQGKAASYHLSPTSALLAIYGLVLGRWSTSQRFLINLTLFNRLPLHEQVNELVGDFTTLELLTFSWSPDQSFRGLVKQTQDNLWEDLDHRLFTGVEVQRELLRLHQLGFDQALAPVVLTSTLNLSLSKGHAYFLDRSYQGIAYSITQTPQVWLDNKAYEADGHFIAEWDYVSELFDPETIQAMHTAYCHLIEHFAVHEWTERIPEFLPAPMLATVEAANDTDQADILPTQTLAASVVTSAEHYPTNVAVLAPTATLSYQELLSKSYQVAHWLEGQGVERHELVAVYAERGWQQVVACLGVMLSGAAYLPLNIEWPVARLEEVLQEGEARIVLTTEKQLDQLAEELKTGYRCMAVDSKQIRHGKATPFVCKSGLDDLAYVIFTSGSTGVPKGVMIAHRGAMNTINDINTRFAITAEDKVFGLSALSFDLSVYDLFGLLSRGGSVVLPADAEYRDPQAWVNLLVEHGVTVWNTVPLLMQMLVDYLSSQPAEVVQKVGSRLRLILLSGDWLPVSLVEQIKLYFPRAAVISLGGATEGSIWSILYPIKEIDMSWDSIPYGRAMYNQRMYVLNEHLEYCPLGVVGDIYIGGLGVGLGYWRDEFKTVASFIIHPRTGERLYRTGDLGKVLADGAIRFMGRKDQQVKLGGYRVELGEIEGRLTGHKLIEEAVVVPFGDQASRHLLAYVVVNDPAQQQLAFKLQRLGIRADGLGEEISLPHPGFDSTTLKQYFGRKSYRRFTEASLSLSEVNKLVQSVCACSDQGSDAGHVLGLRFLSELLLPLRSYQDSETVLPKYRYPSAGSLYPVRLYVSILRSYPGIPAGHYYYHPDKHALIKVLDCKEDQPTGSEVSLSLYGYLPAIRPLYQSSSEAYCYLEAGYMWSLLATSAQAYEYGWQQTDLGGIEELSGDRDYVLTLELALIPGDVLSPELYALPLYLLDKQEEEWVLYQWDQGRFSPLTQTRDDGSEFSESQQVNAGIFKESSALMFFGKDAEIDTLLMSGRMSQMLMDRSWEYGIGMCVLGGISLPPELRRDISFPAQSVCLALGKVSEESIQTHATIQAQGGEDQSVFTGGLLEELQAYLGEYLPSYMIPSRYMVLDKLPIGPTGKIDRKALPEPDVSGQISQGYVAPCTETEHKLCQVWQVVLGLDRVGVQDNFFHIGGDSILSIQVVSKARDMGLSLQVQDIFTAPTIAQLAMKVEPLRASQADQGLVQGLCPLLPIQQWFFDEQYEYPHHWNQAQLLKVDERIDPDQLRAALEQLIAQHDSLRFRYRQTASGSMEQYYSDDATSTYCLEVLDLVDIPSSRQAVQIASWGTSLQGQLNYETGPVMAVGLIQGHVDGSDRLLIAIHHLMIDGVSWRILLPDLQTLYSGGSLPSKTHSYQAWSTALLAYAQDKSVAAEGLAYWRSVEEKLLSVQLPYKPGASLFQPTRGWKVVDLVLDSELTDQLLHKTSHAYNTQINDLLLTAFSLALGSLSEAHTRERLVGFRLEGYGREQIDASLDLTRTVGWFTSIYPVILSLPATADLHQMIPSIKEQLRSIPDKGLSYGVLAYLHPDESVRSQLHPEELPRVSFNYLGQFDQSLQEQTTGWQLTGDSSGDAVDQRNHLSNHLDVNGLVLDNQLHFTLAYSTAHFTAETIRGLQERFEQRLKEIVNHCTQRKECYATPSDYPLVDLNQSSLDVLLAEARTHGEVEDLYPASPLQSGLLFHALHSPSSDQYSVQVQWTYGGALDAEALKRAWQEVIGQHAILRTGFNWIQGDVLQVVYRSLPLEWESIDLSELSAADQATQVGLIQQADRMSGFSLDHPPLLRFKLLRLQSDRHVFLFNHHHILLDGWSNPILFKQVHETYEHLNQGKGVPYYPIVPYSSYISWLKEQDQALAQGYWQGKLSGIERATDIGIRRANVHLDSSKPIEELGKLTHVYSAKETDQLQKFVQGQQVTLNTLVQLAWGRLLHTYSGGDDRTVHGTVVSGRSHALAGMDQLVGLLINTLPVVLDWGEEVSISGQLKRLHEQVQQINYYSYVSLSEVQQYAMLAGGSLFHSLVVFENYPLESLGEGAVIVNEVKSFQKTNYPLTLTAYVTGGELHLEIDYDQGVFEEGSIERLVVHLRSLLTGFMADAEASPQGVSLLTAEEYQQIVYGWNQTASVYPQDKTVHELFEDQVSKMPEKVAVVFEGEELTYDELNGRANQVARAIQKAYQDQTGEGIKADTLIGISVEASLELVIGILGILKSGGGYVPIDPGYPAERIQYMLADTRTQVLLTQSNLTLGQSVAAPGQEAKGDSVRDLLPGHISILYLDQAACYSNEETSNLSPVSGSHDLAYVIYTSGSTGKPKGVMVEHHSVANFISHIIGKHQINNQSRISQFSSLSFDASVAEICGALLTGSQLYIIPSSIRKDPVHFARFIESHQVTFSYIPPSLLTHMPVSTSPQTIALLGESPNGPSMQRWSTAKHTILNTYGPVETTVWVTESSPYQGGNPNTIGRPIYNVMVYVLDQDFNPVPIGVPGELYIGGVGVARGYLNQDELTQERFIANPFASQEDKAQGRNLRLYKSGDLVKWLPDGNLVYQGRTDFQVKLRGYRIELGEIEAVLSRYAGIAQSVVLMQEAKEEKYLVAYYVFDAGSAAVTTDTLRSYLQTRLPEYMVPSFFVQLEAIPLTVNGKIDRRALPEPDVRGQIAQGYVAPRTETEHKLCEVWQKVLGLDRVGVQDNFFHIGGHSLLAIELAQRLSQSFSIPMPVKTLFDNPTIRQLGHYVDEQQSKIDSVAQYTLPTIKPHTEAWYEPFPLTPVQQAYLLGRESLFTLGNIATHIYIVFRFAQLDVGRLEQAWNTLIKRHLALRIVFEAGQQRFLASVPAYTIRVYKLQDEASAVVQQTLDTIQDEMSHQMFDPTEYPLFDLRVSQLPEEVRLHCSFDALLMDGFSMMLLFDELTTLYQEPAACLPPLAISFRDYILELETLKESEPYKQDQQYWQAKLPYMPFGPALALQKQPAEIKQPVFARLTRTIEASIWEAFQGKAASYHLSPTSALLAIYGLVLGRWSTSQRFLINLTLFNRLPLHEQVNDLVGDFTTLELLTFAWSPDQSFRGLVKQTQDNLWEDLDHRLFTGVEVQRELLRLHQLGFDQSLAPVVLTSMLNLSLSKGHAYFLDRSYQGIAYSITQTPQVWLDNKAYEADGHFIAEWDYVSELFDRETIQAMHTAYCHLIEHFAVHEWTERIPEFLPAPMLATVEAANDTDQADILPTQTLAASVVTSAEHYPTNVAVLAPTATLSYQELLSKSYQVAHWLEGQGVERHELVAVYAERGWQQVVACLGVMLSGAAYLPLNIEWPVARLEEVLQEGEARIVLTTEKQLGQLAEELKTGYRCMAVDSKQIRHGKATPVVCKSGLDDLAYVIFTSGSTGVPKGVMIAHRGAMNTINDINTRFAITAEDKVFGLSALSFDLSVYDLFGLLSRGGSVVLPADAEYRDPQAWVDLLVKHGVTVWNTVPLLMQMLVDYLSSQPAEVVQKVGSRLRLILLSGDWLPVSLVEQIRCCFPQATVISLGGATEGSIWSILYPIKEIDMSWDSIPYGRAMYNQRMYVLNEHLEYCPLGVVGDIYIGGLGVGLGYWRDEFKTVASFIIHPRTGERLYRTGDLGKVLADGAIRFMGRKDQQVKLGGYRVELGEIEGRLTGHKLIEEAVVVPFGDQASRHLLAYVVVNDPAQQQLAFKLQRLGIRADGLGEEISLPHPGFDSTTLKQYFGRKSYRRFTEASLSLSEVNKLVQSVCACSDQGSDAGHVLGLRFLSELLLPLRSYQDSETVLPKYRYPSAGSLYPVRLYVSILRSYPGIPAGHYYYHPDKHALIKVLDCKEDQPTGSEVSLSLYGYLPAIRPLYQSSSEAYCYLEAGYMWSLLATSAQAYEYGWQQTDLGGIEELSGDRDYVLTLELALIPGDVLSPELYALPLYLLDKQEEEWVLYQWDQGRFSPLTQTRDDGSEFSESQQVNAGIFKESSALMFFGKDAEIDTLLMSGRMSQMLMDRSWEYGIGMCVLGGISLPPELRRDISFPAQSVCLALGKVSEESIQTHATIQAQGGEDQSVFTGGLLEELQAYLGEYLPSYMIPSRYMVLDKLPIGPTGKIDRKALPEPDVSGQISQGYVAPCTETEHKLCQVWQVVLGLDRVGVQDNFFHIGGDSILSIQVVSKARDMGLSLQVQDIFTAPTIAQLAMKVELLRASQADQGLVQGLCPLLPIQQWFFDEQYKYPHHWNQAQLLKVDERIDPDQLRAALEQLIAQHDSLRFRYRQTASGSMEQYYSDDATSTYCLEVLDLVDIPSSRQAVQIASWGTSLQGQLNYETGPVMAVGLIQGHVDGSDRLLLAIHHLMIDGLSWRILLPDLQTLYSGSSLPSKTHSYQAWSTALLAYAQDKSVAEAGLAYWRSVEEKLLSVQLPYKPGASLFQPTRGWKVVDLVLDSELTDQLLHKTSHAYNTQINDLLLTAFALALGSLSEAHASERLVGFRLGGHGREQIDASLDLTRTVGWFTSIYPVILSLPATADLHQMIPSIKEQLRSIPDKGLSYGVLAYLHPDESVRSQLHPEELPRVSFNYLGQFDQSLQEQTTGWQLTGDSSGDAIDQRNHLPNHLDVNGFVLDNQLCFTLAYSTAHFTAETIRMLQEQFEQRLKEIVNHCTQRKECYATPSDYPLVDLNQSSLDTLLAEARTHGEVEDLYPASPLQSGLLFHALHSPSSDQYSVQVQWTYEGALDAEALKGAWQEVIGQYAILRTGFNWSQGDQMIQVVYRSLPLDWESIDLSELSAADQATQVGLIQQADRMSGFSLDHPPLLRFKLLRLQSDRHVFLFNHHHILLDGWSNPILFKQVEETYERLIQGKGMPYYPIVPYSSYITWLKEQDQALAQGYWQGQGQLSGIERATDIGIRRTNVQLDSSKPIEALGTLRHVYSQAETGVLQDFVQGQQVTLNTLVQLAWGRLLHTYSGGDDRTVHGMVVSGRSHALAGMDQLVGLLINTLPVVLNWREEVSIAAQLKQLHEQIQQINHYSYVSLAEVQQHASLAGGSLFHSLVVFENYPLESMDKGSVIVSGMQSFQKTNYPLTLTAFVSGGELHLEIGYDRAVFDEGGIERLLVHLRCLLVGFMADAQASHQGVSLLTAEEYEQIVYGWNQTAASYPQDKTVHGLFEEQVSKAPDKIAVVFEGEQLTYGELNGRANQVARAIQKAYQGQTGENFKADTLIAIYVERSLDMVIGILGILKSGGAYVPIDPGYPTERIQYMLADTRAQVLLTQSNLTLGQSVSAPGQEAQGDSLRDLLPGHTSILYLDQAACYAEEETGNLPPVSGSHDLAYVIYTSGTTGKPKGVMVEHHSVVNRLHWMQHTYQFDEKDKVLQKTPYGFDVSVWEILLPLLSGSQLVVSAPGVYRDPQVLIEQVKRYRVTKLHFVPSMLAVFMEAMLETDKQLLSLSMIFCSGEALPLQLITKVKSRYPAIAIHNLYGPTETAIDVTYYNDIQLSAEVIPIGRPLWNITVYILDTNHQPVPIGVSGELYIGGVGVARGYLNQEELTQERFIANPFASQEDKSQGRNLRLYKSGDLVKWLPNGNLVYLGRSDFQVKLRGYRIELGEIEALLSGYGGIGQCVVLMQEAKEEKYLVAYYVLDNESGSAAVTPEVLRTYLQTKLPEYMVPSFFVPLEKLPLTVNGKVDRKALPEPDVRGQIAQGYVAPRTETERKLCEVWQKVLGLDRVGVQDNFFHIGGDSILSIQVIAKARDMGLALQVQDIFAAPTIAQLAMKVEPLRASQADQGLVHGQCPLLPIQEWFFDQHYKYPHHWNQAQLLKVDDRIDLDQLRAALEQLVAQHDSLRLRYRQRETGSMEQYYTDDPTSTYCLETLDLSDIPSATQAAQITSWGTFLQGQLNYETGPVMAVGLIRGHVDGSDRLLLAIHHLVVDGVSWRILLPDLQALYSGGSLPSKTYSYQAWANALLAYAQDKAVVAAGLAYWRSVEEKLLSVQLPYKPGASLSQPTRGRKVVDLVLDSELTDQLLHKTSHAYNTQINDLLLTAFAFALALGSLSGANASERLVGFRLEGHGREQIDASLDLSRTVGWFTSLYPVILSLPATADLHQLIPSIKEQLRAIPDKGLSYGLLAYLHPDESVRARLHPDQLPGVSFNYLGQFDQSLRQTPGWQLVSDSSGDAIDQRNHLPNHLDVNGFVLDNQLCFTLAYSTAHFTAETIRGLQVQFERHLKNITKHCVEREGTYATPSDYPLLHLLKS